MCFFEVEHYFGHISGMAGPIDVRRKEKASVGYWYGMWSRPLTWFMPLTQDVSKSNFEIAVSQELLVGLMTNEKKAN